MNLNRMLLFSMLICYVIGQFVFTDGMATLASVLLVIFVLRLLLAQIDWLTEPRR